MHVHCQGCRGRSPCQSTLLLANLAESQPQAAEFSRHHSQEVLGCSQLLKVLEEEPVLPIVRCGTLGAIVYKTVRKNELGHFGTPFSCRDIRTLPVRPIRDDRLRGISAKGRNTTGPGLAW